MDKREVLYEKLRFCSETHKGATDIVLVTGSSESQINRTSVFESSAGEQDLYILGGDKNTVSGDRQTRQQIHNAFSLAAVKTQNIHRFIPDGCNHLSHGRQYLK